METFLATLFLTGLVLVVVGYDARHKLSLQERGHIGLARLSVGIVMMSVAVGHVGWVVLEALGSSGR